MDDSTSVFVVAVVAVVMLGLILVSIGFDIVRVRRIVLANQPIHRWMLVTVAIQGFAVVAYIEVLGVSVIGG